MNIDEIRADHEQLMSDFDYQKGSLYEQAKKDKQIAYLLNEVDRREKEVERVFEVVKQQAAEIKKRGAELEKAEEMIKASIEHDCDTCIRCKPENIAECPYWPCDGEQWDWKKQD
jgi:hypothetical protein